jgi:AraC-like DNA-binding protein
MSEQGAEFSAVRFCSEDLPECDRIPFCLDVFGRQIARVEMEPMLETRFQVYFAARALPGLNIWTGTYSPMRVVRTRELTTDGNDDVALITARNGGSTLSQRGQELAVNGGEAVLSSASEPWVASRLELSMGVSAPRKILAGMVPNLEDYFIRPVPRDSEALRLLKSYVAVLGDDSRLSSAVLRQAVVTHVHDLMALALGAARDSAQIANDRGLRAARLHAIKTDVLASLDRQDLTLAMLAARHNVTPRYVQMLFEREGTTFSQFVLDQRLARAHRMLRDTRYSSRTISTIAYEAGFGDLSHFNRAFRRRYGENPSGVRAAALGGKTHSRPNPRPS